MGTYMTAVAEVKCADAWVIVDQPVFPHSVADWDTVTKDRRPHIERPFYWQDYGMFGFLAGTRNASKSAVLAEPRGVPADISEGAASEAIGLYHVQESAGFGGWEPPPRTLVEQIKDAASYSGKFNFSWLLAKELLDFDYDAEFLDEREAPPKTKSYREFLGKEFFAHLDVLRVLGHPEGVRVVFWFI